MSLSFLILAIHTIVAWVVVFFLHKMRERITLIPLYVFLGILTVYTHVLSSFGLSTTAFDIVFLISSNAYFTPLLLGVFLLYLSEGPKYARMALIMMVTVSVFQLVTVYLVALEDMTISWIPATTETLNIYFWSVLAMILDVAFMGIGWELLAGVKKVSIDLALFILLWFVFILDAIVFVTGVFLGEPFYLDILLSDTYARFFLALIMGLVLARYLKFSKYSEEDRVKPKKFWEILDFISVDEKKIAELHQELSRREMLEKQLRKAEETYKLALEGSAAGIWEWDIKTGNEAWSPRFYELLGYKEGEIKAHFDTFLAMLHPNDIDGVQKAVEDHLTRRVPFSVEYRLKRKDGNFAWFLGSGKAVWDKTGTPIKMVGSIIDIDDRKIVEDKLAKKLKELSKLNASLVDRELKMVELKKKLNIT